MRVAMRHFYGPKTTSLAYIRPATRTSTLCTPSSSPRASLAHFSPRAGHARVVYHSSSRSEVRLLHTSRSRARRAPRSPPARSSVPPGPERETLPYARQSRRFVARSRAVGTIEPRKRARSASRRARSSSRITVARRLTPPASPLRSQTRARGGRAEASSRRQTWAGPLEASTRPRCGLPRAAGSRTRSTGRGTRCSGSRSLAWRAPPSSTTAGRWSRGRSRPPAGSPARRGAPTSPREARRSRGRHRQS